MYTYCLRVYTPVYATTTLQRTSFSAIYKLFLGEKKHIIAYAFVLVPIFNMFVNSLRLFLHEVLCVGCRGMWKKLNLVALGWISINATFGFASQLPATTLISS